MLLTVSICRVAIKVTIKYPDMIPRIIAQNIAGKLNDIIPVRDKRKDTVPTQRINGRNHSRIAADLQGLQFNTNKL